MSATAPDVTRHDPVDVFAGLLRLRDGRTARYAERVAALARAAGEQLDLDDDTLALLENAARVQDVAKIALPDRILHTHRPLTREERTAVHRHSQVVTRMLASIPGLDDISPVLSARYEHWDGSGHPFALTGDAIPLGSRILAVCDAYCALTRTTSYRDGVLPERAIGALEAASGTRFDPEVVSAVVSALANDISLRRAPDPAPGAERNGRFTRNGQGSITATEPAAGLGRRLMSALDALRLPALAETHSRMTKLLDENPLPTSSLADVAELDPGMSARLLRAAGPECPGVPQALDGMTRDSLAVLLDDMPKVDFFARLPSGQSMEQFRVHAVATRRAARRLARLTDHEAPDRIAAAALLHDIGKLVLSIAAPKYAETLATRWPSPEVAVREERRAFALDHATAGATLLRHWGIHDAIIESVSTHHNTTESHDGALICLADLLAHAGSGDAVDPHAMTDLANGLGVSSDELRALLFELQPAGTGRSERPDPCPLSAKELSLVRGLAEGKQYKAIAEDHGIALSTVRSHFSNIYSKLSVTDRAQAVLTAATRGWL